MVGKGKLVASEALARHCISDGEKEFEKVIYLYKEANTLRCCSS